MDTQPRVKPGAAEPEPGRNLRDGPVDEALDEAVEESMAASDPIAVHTEDPVEIERRKRAQEEDGQG